MKGKILIVDDNLTNINVVANILSKHEYNFEYVTSGKEAIEWVKEEKFDLILLDIMMPEMDGYETCKKIKEIDKEEVIAIIFLTAKNDIHSIEKGFDCGGVDYISKPFNSKELIARVNAHIKIKQLMRVVQQKNIELNESNQSKDKFFSIIAHDLRSPLSAVMQLADLSFKNADFFSEEDMKTNLKLILDTSKESYDLLKNLLEWARVKMGSLKPEVKQILLRDIIEETVSLVKSSAEQKEINLFLQVEEDLCVEADRNMIKTVLRNLCNNSIKFTERKGYIKIIAEFKDNHVEVNVIDNGVGMDPQIQNELFKIESNISENGTEGETGTGLGLILCKELIELNHGKIWVESKKGIGTQFSFSIPACLEM